MFELVDSAPQSAIIKVVGVGGGGGNAVQHMLRKQVDGVDFIAANTDAQALKHLEAKTVLQIGSSITKEPIPRLAGRLRWKTVIASPRSWWVPTWYSSPPVWAGVPEPGLRPSWRMLLGIWRFSR